jgi:ferredoxin
MIAVQQSVFESFLKQQDEKVWTKVLSQLIPSIHPVDQVAVQIWFSFWPLKLSRALQAPDPALKAKEMLLDGKFRLEEQVDSSVQFLFGSRYWPDVKATLLATAEIRGGSSGDLELERFVRDLAKAVADKIKTSVSVVLGISAVACMILQQVGVEVFAASVPKASNGDSGKLTPDEVSKNRNKKDRQKGLLSFLRSADKKYTVSFDQTGQHGTFGAMRGQDLSMACAVGRKQCQSGDHRCVEGPIPCQCRSGACGYCWIGIMSGKENLSEISDFERRRLSYFGYASSQNDGDSHPHIRLACQAKCYGEVSIVIPPWNGTLNGRT